MEDVTINYNEDPEELKSMNYDEPVIEIHTGYSHRVIPASRVCYHDLKKAIDDADETARYWKNRIVEPVENP